MTDESKDTKRRSSIGVSYFRSEFLEGNDQFDAFSKNVRMKGLTLRYHLTLKNFPNYTIGCRVEFFSATYQIVEPFNAPAPFSKHIFTTAFEFGRYVLNRETSKIQLILTPKFRLGTESYTFYRSYWELLGQGVSLADFGLGTYLRFSEKLRNHIWLNASIGYTRFIYRNKGGFNLSYGHPSSVQATTDVIDMSIGISVFIRKPKTNLVLF